jgi:hypothetical protein
MIKSVNRRYASSQTGYATKSGGSPMKKGRIAGIAIPLLVVTGVALPPPALAIDKAGAIASCAAAAEICSYTPTHGGGIILSTDQSDGHTSSVYCPPQGDCSIVIARPAPKGGKPPAGSLGNVTPPQYFDPGSPTSPGAPGVAPTGRGPVLR